MRLVIFVGPSIRPALVREAVQGVRGPVAILPPAAQGDLADAVARYRPNAVGLIDGRYERVPSVWHKEILWALSEGVHVWGAASMGALRAAETAAYGMVGIGQVYSWYAQEWCTRDDDVAVAHLGPDEDWRPVSLPTVDVLAATQVGVDRGHLDEAAASRWLARARDIPYPRRDWASVVAGPLPAWLPTQSVKERDALALLKALAEPALRRPHRPSFALADTDNWLAVRPTLAAQAGTSDLGEADLVTGLARVLARATYPVGDPQDALTRLAEVDDEVDAQAAPDVPRAAGLNAAHRLAFERAWQLFGRDAELAAADAHRRRVRPPSSRPDQHPLTKEEAS